MSNQDLIREGDSILLFYDKRRKWLLKASDREFHTHKGIVQLGEIVGKKYGTPLKSSFGCTFWVLPPTTRDRIMFMKRHTQILYPKDIGYLLFIMDLSPGKVVLEVGTGSAALTIAMANLVKPTGHVYSYEVRESFARMAEKNIERAGLASTVTVKNLDASLGIVEENFDAAVLDVGAPWQVIPSIKPSLKPGGILCSFSPTINQVEKTVEALKGDEFLDIESCELIKRDIRVELGRTRPKMTMIGHTGYLTFARKVLGSA